MWRQLYQAFTECPRWYYGGSASRASMAPHRTTVVAAALLALWYAPTTAQGQQANPGFDPRQTEKHFDDLQSGDGRPARPPLPMPALARPAVVADGKRLFVLRAVSITGASAVSHDRLV